MKAFKIIMLLFTLILINSCENYTDSSIDYSPIYPMCGEWRVRITDTSTGQLVTSTVYTLNTYNTTKNDVDSMWIRVTSSMAGGLGTLRGKISCDVKGLNFSGANVPDISVIAPATATFNITDGKITLNAIDMPSGVKADKLSFKYTTTKVGGKTFLFEGFRQTLWPSDQNYNSYK
jgi:hypothetical protein